MARELFFGGEDAAFKAIVSQARVYGEYGVGRSTEYVYKNTDAKILAVETSKAWALKVTRGKDMARLRVFLVNVGPVGDRGYPVGYSMRMNFPLYANLIWRQDIKPDVVLIDGRFRVACFLTSLLLGPPGLQIIFDDYIGRPYYHVVEEILAPRERGARQAIFEKPETVEVAPIRRLLGQFRTVRD